MRTKAELTLGGIELAEQFCRLNGLLIPAIELAPEKDWRFGVCAYYREGVIHLHVPSCARIGTGGASWSYPGYFVDRTPYGVIQHELGHHVDFMLGQQKGKYWSEFGEEMRRQSGEDKLTNYCPNDAEWFAEIFRLFVTNSDLLRLLRPRVYALLKDCFTSVITIPWREVLKDAPERNIGQCLRRIEEAEKSKTIS